MGQLTQVSTEMSSVELLKVSLEKKKHKMGKVVLDQVLELEEKLLSCKKEVMDGQQKFPRQPEDNHEELASQLQKAVQSISEKLRPLKRELAAHKKWDLGLKVKVLQRRNSLESQPLACTRPAAAFRKAPNLGHLALTLDESLLAVWKTRSICKVPPRVASTTTCDFFRSFFGSQ